MSREYIAKKLQELRIKSGLTADEVGKRIGKSGKTVNAWEHNRGQPDAEILIELCDIYQVEDILKEFRDEKPAKQTFSVSDHEKEIIIAYRKYPNVQFSIDCLLLGLSSIDGEKEKRA